MEEIIFVLKQLHTQWNAFLFYNFCGNVCQVQNIVTSNIYLKIVKAPPIFICYKCCPKVESLPLVNVYILDEKCVGVGKKLIVHDLREIKLPGRKEENWTVVLIL